MKGNIEVRASAELSPDGVYRYRLDRAWDDSLPRLVFLMLNPSTADATRDDPTLRRCMSFTRSLGHGSLSVVNLYALRTADPRELRLHHDPVGPLNDDHISETVLNAGTVIAGWGTNAWDHARVERVCSLVAGPIHALGLTKDGHPRHPLYLRGDSRLVEWRAPGGVTMTAQEEIRLITEQIRVLEARRARLTGEEPNP